MKRERTELWGHCPSCPDKWFLVIDPTLDAMYRCPVCLLTGDRFERRKVVDEESAGGAA